MGGPARITAQLYLPLCLTTACLSRGVAQNGRAVFIAGILWPKRGLKVSTEMAIQNSVSFNDKQPTIHQHPGQPKGASFEKVDQLLIIVPERVPAAVWRKIPQGMKLKTLLRRRGAASVPCVVSRLGNKRQTGVMLANFDSGADAFEQLTRARKLVAAACAEKPRSLGIWAVGFDEQAQQQIVSRVTSAALAAAFVMPAYKSSPSKSPIGSMRVFGLSEQLDLSRVNAEASANNLVRWLTALPANRLDAESYAELARSLAKSSNWQFKKYTVKDLQKLGAGAFLAVAQGNDNDSASIVHLKYRPADQQAPADLSLVGKGIIFDTGGTNLKPFQSMLDMHIDMSGSAVALATLKAISDLRLPLAVDCWLAITENRTGPLAYKSQDILTAANGTTIQTIHTDAEGRLALADTLVLASREQPGMIIDYATLTGACVTGITSRYSGVFSNRSSLHPILKRAGRKSGERVWPFPIGAEFVEGLKSDTADLKQCTPGGGGDHIYAASFLGEFVDSKIPWVHVDLSACTQKGGLAHIPTEITGFGVHFTMNLLLEQQVLSQER